LRIFAPDGTPFRSHEEIEQERKAEQAARMQAEQERETERTARMQAEQRAERLAARLREMGVEPEGLESGGAVEAEDDKQ
jgi:hypothetical protein